MSVDAPYVIAVLRQREKELLEHDEYTRLIDAPDADTAVASLADTVYGTFMSERTSASAFAAIDAHLARIMEWLDAVVDDGRIMTMLHARYDALNIITAVHEYQAGRQEPSELSSLGSIAPAVLHSAIWNDLSFDDIPDHWQSLIRAEKEQMPERGSEATAWKNEVRDRVAAHAAALLASNVHSPLTRWYSTWARTLRTAGDTTPQNAQTEKAHDETLIDALRPWRWDPTSTDAIVAFWLTLELEAKSVRLALTAKLQGLPAEDIHQLVRPLVHETP